MEKENAHLILEMSRETIVPDVREADMTGLKCSPQVLIIAV